MNSVSIYLRRAAAGGNVWREECTINDSADRAARLQAQEPTAARSVEWIPARVEGYLQVQCSMQRLNLMTQPIIPTALGRPPAIAPNAPAPKSVCAGETEERRQSLEFFSFDGDYVRRLTEGDAETERHFVGYFSPLLLIKLKQRLRSREQVENLRQEVFLRVLRSLRQGSGLEHPEFLGAYVHSICNNVVLDHLRGKSKPQQWDERVEEQLDSDAYVGRELVNESQSRQVRSLIDGMTPKDRFLIRAIFLDKRDKDAVCREQGVGRDYLRVLLHRAKKRFRQLLAETQANGAYPVTSYTDL
jgi:RNA polymerase sigma-70 factor (ECF subfamily)